MRKFLIVFRKILCLCNFHILIQISILRALQSKWFPPSTSWFLRYVFEASSSVPRFSSCLFLPLPLPLSRRDIPPPPSLPLCQPHPLGCDVSISGPVQQMMSCNWVAASRGSLGSCVEGLFLLSNLSTLIRKVGVNQTVPYSATNFLFSKNTWFLGSVYSISNLLRGCHGQLLNMCYLYPCNIQMRYVLLFLLMKTQAKGHFPKNISTVNGKAGIHILLALRLYSLFYTELL